MSVVVKVGAEHRGSNGRFMGAPEVGGLGDFLKRTGTSLKQAAGRGTCYNARYQDLHDLERKLDEPNHTTLTEQDIAMEKNMIARQGGICRSNRLQAFAPNKIHAGLDKMGLLNEETRLRSGEKAGADTGAGPIPPQFRARIAKERAMGKNKAGCKSCMGAPGLEISL